MKRILPPTYLLGAIILMVAFHFLCPLRQISYFPCTLVGIVPLTVGIVLNLLADRSFKRHSTTVKPFQESRVLVTHGVFRISRHPMYLGMVLILVGIAMLLGSASAWAIVVAFGVVFDWFFIRAEERMLAETFGAAFEQYRKRVRRWL